MALRVAGIFIPSRAATLLLALSLVGGNCAVSLANDLLSSPLMMMRGPGIKSLSREVGSSAGGTRITIAGSGFASGATVTFGEPPAIAAAFIDSTQLSVVAPPHTPGTVNVVVTNPDGGSATRKSAFDYQPAATKTYFAANFEDRTLGRLRGDTDLTPNCLTPTVQAQIFAGSSAAKTGGNTGNSNRPCNPSRLHYQFCSPEAPFSSASTPCNPGAANPNGYYVHFRLMLDQNAIDNCTHQQCKLFFNRFDPPVQAPSFSWIVLGIGYGIGGGGTHALANQVDSGIVAPNNPAFASIFVAMEPKDLECQFVRNTKNHVGTVNCWVDGKKWWTQTDPTLGSDRLSERQTLEFGLTVYEAGGKDGGTGLPWTPVGAQMFIYVDDVAAADGWIEP